MGEPEAGWLDRSAKYLAGHPLVVWLGIISGLASIAGLALGLVAISPSGPPSRSAASASNIPSESLLYSPGPSALPDARYGPPRATAPGGAAADGFSYVTLDSFAGSGTPVRDERAFYTGCFSGDKVFTNSLEGVRNGEELTADIYIDNDADARLNDSGAGVARNVTVRVSIPIAPAPTQITTAYVSAQNARPSTVWDSLPVTANGGQSFKLAYEKGSAQIYGERGVSDLTGAQEAQLLGEGLNLGDQPGGYDHIQMIRFRLRVDMPNYAIQVRVRIHGHRAAGWSDRVDAMPGNTIDWSIDFTNNGSTQLDRVALVAEVPTGLTVVPASVVLYDAQYPDGYVFPSSAIQAGGRQLNVDVGDVLPLSSGSALEGKVSAQLIYSTELDHSPSACTLLTTKAWATPENYGSVWQAAAVVAATATCPSVG